MLPCTQSSLQVLLSTICMFWVQQTFCFKRVDIANRHVGILRKVVNVIILDSSRQVDKFLYCLICGRRFQTSLTQTLRKQKYKNKTLIFTRLILLFTSHSKVPPLLLRPCHCGATCSTMQPQRDQNQEQLQSQYQL